VGYVTLKHALSAAALAAVDDPDRAPVVAALAAVASSGPLSGDELARQTGRSPDDIRRDLLATGVCVDTGDGGVGLDPAFAPHAAYAARQTARAVGMTRALSGPAPSGLLPVVWRAMVLFNVGLFFECHEYLERPWRAARGDRALYHGLIQAAAGCYHCERGNVHGTAVLLGKAIAKLRAYAPAALGIDVSDLLDGLAGVRAAALAVPPRLPRGREHLPVIRLAADPDTRAAAAG
jgi:hypothetical protein